MKFLTIIAAILFTSTAFAHEGHGLAESLAHNLYHVTGALALLAIGIFAAVKIAKHIGKGHTKQVESDS